VFDNSPAAVKLDDPAAIDDPQEAGIPQIHEGASWMAAKQTNGVPA
jgi:hypothetical protein